MGWQVAVSFREGICIWFSESIFPCRLSDTEVECQFLTYSCSCNCCEIHSSSFFCLTSLSLLDVSFKFVTSALFIFWSFSQPFPCPLPWRVNRDLACFYLRHTSIVDIVGLLILKTILSGIVLEMKHTNLCSNHYSTEEAILLISNPCVCCAYPWTLKWNYTVSTHFFSDLFY